MFARASAILVAAATVVAGIYAVVAYHFPRDDKAAPVNIQQTTKGDNSPNIISGGNVNVNIKGR